MTFENNIRNISPDTTLEELAIDGLKKRLTAILVKYSENNTKQQAYWDRLYSELAIIKQEQLSGCFMMMSDIVNWARDHGIPVGPGKGAIVGSIVAYAIRITDIDPMRYDLLFERYLNTERMIMPSVDMDCCEDRRDEVVQYVLNNYGGDLDNDGCCLRINLPVKLDHAVLNVAQAEKKQVEANSHIMHYFHGLKHLTSNNKAVRLIRAGKLPDFDLANLRDDDEATFNLIASGNTKNTFQFDSVGMKKFIRQLKPNCFEDLIALSSLYRPGPILSGMVDDFIKRKHGHRKIIYERPQLVPILKCTYGAMIYHEQVMEIIQAIAGYSLGEADLLRRKFVTLSIPAFSIEKERFLAGAQKQGISARTATIILNRMAKYAEFCFLKAHATAYALISYQSAYLKAHYPEEFEKALRPLSGEQYI